MAERIETDLIVRAVAEGFDKMAGAMGETAAEVKRLEETTQKSAKGLLTFRGANQDAAGAARAFGVDLAALSNPLTLTATLIKGAIDKTMQWGDTIDELTRITGESAEETSKMAIVLNDWGISTDSLKGAARALKEEGLAPSLSTLKALAAEYQTLPAGAARTEWGTKKLGRAYFELSEVLTKTPAQFDEMSQAAAASGKVMNEAVVQQAEDAAIKAKQLGDVVDGLQIQFANELIPVLYEAGTALHTLLTWDTRVQAALTEHTDEVLRTATSYQAYHDELMRVNEATGKIVAITDEFGNVQGYVTDQTNILTEAQFEARQTALALGDTRAEAIAQSREYAGLIQNEQAAEEALKAAKELSNSVYSLAIMAVKDANIGLAQQIELTEALALASGEMTVEELANQEAIGFLIKQLELGNITMAEYLESVDKLGAGLIETGALINEVGASIRGLPSSKTIRINVVTSAGEAGIGPEGPTTVTPTPGEGPTGGKFQHGTGGWLTVPPGFRENYTIGMSSGERYAVAPSGGNSVSGGDEVTAMLRQLPNLIARGIRDGMQLAR